MHKVGRIFGKLKKSMQSQYKGKKIKASDNHLLHNFIGGWIAFLFLLLMTLLYSHKLVAYPWETFSLRSVNAAFFVSIHKPYLIFSVILSLLLSVGSMAFFMHKKKIHLRALKQRQELAAMILENKWYDSEMVTSSSFFKDLGGGKSKEKIINFPKMYYRYLQNRIYLTVRSTMGKNQEQLMKLQKKVETGLFCEFIERTAKNPYYQYTFYCGLDETRLNISDVTVKAGEIELMEGFSWNYDKLPHALIVGGTGSGKTYFLLTLIQALAGSGAALSILDPKNADLADYKGILPDVYTDPEDIISCVSDFAERMLRRSEEMKQHPDYQMGKNYAALGLKPHFLVFDEYVAFFEMLGYKKSDEVMAKLKQIAMLGRQAGFFLILACQRADAKYLADGIRDQFHFRVALGRNSELGYKMIFGEQDKEFLTMPAGRGYVDMGKNLVTEFYAPFIPADYDFMAQIERLVPKKKEVVSTKKEESEAERDDEDEIA